MVSLLCIYRKMQGQGINDMSCASGTSCVTAWMLLIRAHMLKLGLQPAALVWGGRTFKMIGLAGGSQIMGACP